MRTTLAKLTLIAVTGLFCLDAGATDRFHRDLEAQSPSGRYVVTAQSPDNQTEGRPTPFQENFIYTCKDTLSGETLWTRHQAVAQRHPEADDSPATYTPQEEGSPVCIFVSDTGWTVIRTAWNDLICVDPGGRDTGNIDLLREAIPEADRKTYVHRTTAGELWSQYSRWYFLQVEKRLLFVIRCWWDRRIAVDVAEGKLLATTDDLSAAMQEAEARFVLESLHAAAAPDRD